MEQCQIFKRAKMLISFLNCRQGERLVNISKEAGARGGTIIHGRGLLDAQGAIDKLSECPTDLVLTIMGQEANEVISHIQKDANDNPDKLRGLAVVVDVEGMLFRVPGNDNNICNEREKEIMQSGYELIGVILNEGLADKVMAEARKAGATGGTILAGRGTGTEEDVKFYGIGLVPEKEILMIIAEKEQVPSILEAINNVPEVSQPGGGVIFYINIELFLPLG